MQERILPETAALQAEMIVYLAQWADEATALMVFKALRRHFTEPDDWRTLMAYCKTVARREAQQDQPGRVIGGRQERREGGNTADGRYTVDEAVDWLQAHECLVHRATIYRWIHAGKITAIDENGGMWLSEDSLRQAREFVRLRQQRKAVRELAQIRGRTSEAARKFVRRRLQKGENLQDIASAIMCKMPDESKERADMGAG